MVMNVSYLTESAALDAIRQYELVNPDITLVKRLENATFRVSQRHAESSLDYALRLHRHGYQSHDSITEEFSVLEKLSKVSEFEVPRPIINRYGHYITTASESPNGRETMAVLFPWREGTPLAQVEHLSTSHLATIGRVVGILHLELAAVDAGEVSNRPLWDADGISGRTLFPSLAGKGQSKWGSATEPDWCERIGERWPEIGLSHDEIQIVLEAAGKINRLFEVLSSARDGWGVIHGDLNLSNFIVAGMRTCVIDFDDMGWGNYMYDLAATLVWIRLRNLPKALETAFIQGYMDHAGHLIAPELLEHAFAAKCFALVRWCVGNYGRDPAIAEWVNRRVPSLIRMLATIELEGSNGDEHRP